MDETTDPRQTPSDLPAIGLRIPSLWRPGLCLFRLLREGRRQDLWPPAPGKLPLASLYLLLSGATGGGATFSPHLGLRDRNSLPGAIYRNSRSSAFDIPILAVL